ncbi:MAG: methyltransferase domain-containing protein [Deltaproteobacteria bacterium]|nr:methyltransferase domain-containing protein [Deltaproteobacteria bacterium]
MQLIGFGKIQAGMKVLDLGCGTGNLSAQLLECVPVEAIGIDKSLGMLKKANTKALQVLCADADANPLPFKNDSFDIVIGAYVIHHIRSRTALIKDCFRILKDDGAMILLTSSHDHIERLHPVIREFFPSLIELDKKRFPDTEELDDIFQTAGFDDIRHEELVLSDIPIDMVYLEKVKNKFVSTFYLLSDNEFQAGVAKLEKFIANSREPVSREWRGLMMYGKKSSG